MSGEDEDEPLMPPSPSTEDHGDEAETEDHSPQEVPDLESPEAESEESSDELSAMTVAELRSLAKEKAITGVSAMNKSQLITALSAAT